MNEFFQRLKERKLVQWTVAYVAAAFALLQGIDIVAQQFGWPEGVRRGITLALVVGFFVTLVLAWYHGERGAQRVGGTELLILALLLGLGGGFLWRFSSVSRAPVVTSANSTAPAAIPEKSIAVLPFENLSDEKANAYFVGGIQDEILTRLSKIADLKVISRTSTLKYKSAPENLREVGSELGVAHLLEGSVQRAGDQVHINVQLINAATDVHLWAESYDRELKNIFSVEGEVAGAIAEALKAKLTGSEKKAIAEKPTQNAAAYEAYLRGTAEFLKKDDAGIRASQVSFEEAVRLDPTFALAWAALSRTHSLLFFLDDATPARSAAAERTLAEAVRLQPDLAETRLAAAYLQYWVRRDYAGSLALMQQLRTTWPNNAEVLQAMAFISARLGHWPESLDEIRQSVTLNPKDIFTRIQALQIALAVRDFPVGLWLADEGLKIWPDEPNLLGWKALACQARGQLDEAGSILSRSQIDPNNSDASGLALFVQTWLRRDPASALKLLSVQPSAADEKDPTFDFGRALLQEVAGQKDAARASFTRARDTITPLVRVQPSNGDILGRLVYTLAALGQRADALHQLDRLLALSSGDARMIGRSADLAARVYARFGDKKRAIASLERVLSAPCDGFFAIPLTPAVLLLDPDFDSLRGDPDFQKLLTPIATDEKNAPR